MLSKTKKHFSVYAIDKFHREITDWAGERDVQESKWKELVLTQLETLNFSIASSSRCKGKGILWQRFVSV